MITAQNLGKQYGQFVALRDISFTIPEGQVVALVGPNGAGKTTLMRVLTGYLAPSGGTASIKGLDIQHQRVAAAELVGYLPENGPLYPDMTPREILQFFGRSRRLAPAYLRARIDQVSADCDIGRVLDKPVERLSKGLRQRVGLAQALLHDPQVLIMDEPTSGLDPNQTRDFRDHVRRLRGRKTLLLSTHLLQEVEAIADRVLLIHQGQLVADASPADLAGTSSLEESFHRYTIAPA